MRVKLAWLLGVLCAGLVWFALDVRARAAAIAAAAFMTLHGLVHVADAMAGREALSRAVFAIPTIYLPVLITLWIAWPQSTPAMEDKTDDQMAVTAADRRIRKAV